MAGEELEGLDDGEAALDRGEQRGADAAPLQSGIDAEAADLADAVGDDAADGSREPAVDDGLQDDVLRDLRAHRVDRLDQRRNCPVVVAPGLGRVSEFLQREDRLGVRGRGVDDGHAVALARARWCSKSMRDRMPTGARSSSTTTA